MFGVGGIALRKTTFSATLITIALLSLSLSLVTTAQGVNSDWRITIDGAIPNPTVFTINDLANMPRTTVQADLYCYGMLVTRGEWAGVELGYLMGQVGVGNLEQVSIDLKASDGYEIKDFPLSTAKRSDVIIAYEKNGTALSEQVRLVVPGTNGNVWISMITQITVKAAAGVSLEALTPPLMPKMTVPSIQDFPSESPATQPSQPAVQSSQNSSNTLPPTQPQQQNRTAPEASDMKSSSQTEQTEPVSLMQPIDYGYVAVAVLLAGLLTSYLLVRWKRNSRKIQA